MDTTKAVVQKVVPCGKHGPFAVATSDKIDSSITFSLEPTVWKEEEWPEEGTLVFLGKLRKKRAGWRAKTGRFFKPSDEQTERRNQMTEQYRRIASKEINAAADRDPQNALLMVLANSTLDEAEQKATGQKPHEPRFHESGWSIAIETPQGIVGLWSCWLNNQFYLGYPKDASPKGGTQAIDKLIMELLGVKFARPVLQVNATAVSEGYEGEFKDPGKPLIKNTIGQIIGYCTSGQRLWAKFYSDPVANKEGRVWVDHSDRNSNGYHFGVVRSDSLENIYYGHDRSRGISTFPFSLWNEYAPDGPTAEPEIIKTYREKFLALACEIARRIGGATAVNINYGFVFVPEQLGDLGYEDVRWLKGRAGVREGWGNEVVRADKPASSEELILKSGNSIVPWSTVRRMRCTAGLNTAQLIEYLTF